MPLTEGMITELIGSTMNIAFFNTRTRHPNGKPIRVMISASLTTTPKFEPWGATKLGAENNKHIIHEPALFKIHD